MVRQLPYDVAVHFSGIIIIWFCRLCQLKRHHRATVPFAALIIQLPFLPPPWCLHSCVLFVQDIIGDNVSIIFIIFIMPKTMRKAPECYTSHFASFPGTMSWKRIATTTVRCWVANGSTRFVIFTNFGHIRYRPLHSHGSSPSMTQLRYYLRWNIVIDPDTGFNRSKHGLPSSVELFCPLIVITSMAMMVWTVIVTMWQRWCCGGGNKIGKGSDAFVLLLATVG